MRETHTAPFSQMETSGPPLSGWPVEELGEKVKNRQHPAMNRVMECRGVASSGV